MFVRPFGAQIIQQILQYLSILSIYCNKEGHNLIFLKLERISWIFLGLSAWFLRSKPNIDLHGDNVLQNGETVEVDRKVKWIPHEGLHWLLINQVQIFKRDVVAPNVHH